MAQQLFSLRTIKDKSVVTQPHSAEHGYLVEFEKDPISKKFGLANEIVISRNEYQLLRIGAKYAQRIPLVKPKGLQCVALMLQ